jgi:uncharacterized protein (DUF983 family)
MITTMPVVARIAAKRENQNRRKSAICKGDVGGDLGGDGEGEMGRLTRGRLAGAGGGAKAQVADRAKSIVGPFRRRAPRLHGDAMSPVVFPQSFWQAALSRGALGHCPRCGDAPLFRRWLKPVDRCAACGQDWSIQRADDFPAYIAILVTGHLLAPVIIWLSLSLALGPLAMISILIPLALVMMLGMLQPAKGAVIAAQWWHGLNGFTRERISESAPEAEPGAEA